MNEANRRELLKFAAKASACTALSGCSLLSPLQDRERHSADGTAQTRPKTPESITRTYVAADCARLALHSKTICPAIKQCLSRNAGDIVPQESQPPTFLEVFQLAGTVQSDNRFCGSIIQQCRDRRPDHKADDLLEDKLAFVLGLLCHNSADSVMYPAGAADAGCSNGPTDCSIYRDAFFIREVFAVDRDAKFDRRQIQELLSSYWQRTLLIWHTFIPDTKDIDGWMERMFAAHKRLDHNVCRYAEAICDPDAGKMKRFVHGPNFYDRRDPLIQLARSLQSGSVETTIDLQKAIQTADSQSLYAQALRKGYTYLQAASDYFSGSIDRSSLFEQLDIEKSII